MFLLQVWNNKINNQNSNFTNYNNTNVINIRPRPLPSTALFTPPITIVLKIQSCKTCRCEKNCFISQKSIDHRSRTLSRYEIFSWYIRRGEPSRVLKAQRRKPVFSVLWVYNSTLPQPRPHIFHLRGVSLYSCSCCNLFNCATDLRPLTYVSICFTEPPTAVFLPAKVSLLADTHYFRPILHLHSRTYTSCCITLRYYINDYSYIFQRYIWNRIK